MHIANEKTFQKFDQLSQNMFRKKARHSQNHAPNPISPRFRWVMPIGLIAGGLWMVHKNTPTIKDYLLQKEVFTYQEYLTYQTLKQYVKCRWRQLWSKAQGKNDPKLINELYLTKLESDLLYLKEKRPQKVLQFQLKTSFSFWMFNFANQQQQKLVTQYGDLVHRNSNSKLMLGSSVKIWNKKQDTILKRQKLFDFYLKEKGKIGKQCQTINSFNKILLDEQQYKQVLNHCRSQSEGVSKKIQNFLEDRLREENKMKRKVK